MDELWVPSPFMRDIVVAAKVKPIVTVMPEPVDVARFDPDTVVAAAESDWTPYVVFDSSAGTTAPAAQCTLLAVGKWEHRKAFDVLLPAVATEFADDPYVHLVIVSHAFHDGNRTWAQRVSDAGGSPLAPAGPRVTVVERIPDALLPRMYRAATGFVLPSRGEGWGRPYAEAASMALPVIATGWSGQTAFLDATNSLVLRFSLAQRNDGSFAASHRWAEPDPAHLRELMRQVCTHQHEALGRRARESMLALGLDPVAAMVHDRVLGEFICRSVLSCSIDWFAQPLSGVSLPRRRSCEQN